ncbi:MAG: DUF4124 domain-containing protein [Xanthomonadaceae bacterium]|nr:DUF4124 domain-containing protein [Xanthomonadaceae bacterium]MDE2225991.1 DUF4124 domain-containing protein [Xanthomonadaceae bacterium]
MCIWCIKPLCLLALLACAPLAHAQHTQPVYRCIGAQGEPVFSGQPCGTPAPAPGTSTSVQGTGSSVGCAPSPEALRQAIAAAFATRDVNQLAGLILWQGMDQASARDTLRSLAAWLKQPLTGAVFTRAADPPLTNAGNGPAPVISNGEPASASSVAAPPTGFGVSTGGVDGATRDFGLVESGGCWWLTF